MPPCCTPNVLHDTLGRGLWLADMFWSHLRSFVTTMRPKHSLNQNIKSVPLVLTGNTHHRAVSMKFQYAAISNPVPIAVPEIKLMGRIARTPLAPVSASRFNTQLPTRLWSNIEGNNETSSLQTNENPRLARGGGPLNHPDPEISDARVINPG
jgi:hypothetical protein